MRIYVPSLIGKRKQKKMSGFWCKRWSWSLEQWSLNSERVWKQLVFDFDAKQLFRKLLLRGVGRYVRVDYML